MRMRLFPGCGGGSPVALQTGEVARSDTFFSSSTFEYLTGVTSSMKG